MIPMVDLKQEFNLYKQSIYDSIKEVLDSGSYILGEKGKKLEKQIASYVNAKFGIGVANGTDALLLALDAIGIGKGDEVITTSFTFFATAEVIAKLGATPVFVDIDPATYNIDPEQIKKAITKNTKAIIVVHLYGLAVDMDSVLEIAKEHGLKVIEDACQAIGTDYNGKRVGSIGDVGCFSFFPSKNLGAFGDAGMVVTNDQDIYEKICELRNHGSKERYIHESIGYNSRLDEIQAAILLEKIKYLDIFLMKRRSIANEYTEELNGLVKTPAIYNDRQHTFHQYCIKTDEREKLAAYLNKNNISTAIYYPIPLHLQQAFKYLGYKQGDLPITEEISKTILALPIFPAMTVTQHQLIISKIKEFFEEA